MFYLTSKKIFWLSEQISFSHFDNKIKVEATYVIFWINGSITKLVATIHSCVHMTINLITASYEYYRLGTYRVR